MMKSSPNKKTVRLNSVELSRSINRRILQESDCIEKSSVEFILDLMELGNDLSMQEVIKNCVVEITYRFKAYKPEGSNMLRLLRIIKDAYAMACNEAFYTVLHRRLMKIG